MTVAYKWNNKKSPPTYKSRARSFQTLAFAASALEKYEKHNRLWTFWTLWDPIVAELLASILVKGYISISHPNFVDLLNACITNLHPNFRGLQNGFFVMQVRECGEEACTNQILHSRDAFVYSWVSRRTEMNIQILSFQKGNLNSAVDNNKNANMNMQTLQAYDELAQILAIKAQVNDILVVSGKRYSSLKDGANIVLNANDYNTDMKTWMDVIHFSFNVKKRITMIERISPDMEQRDKFQLNYRTCKTTCEDSKRPIFREATMWRTFDLAENLNNCDLKPIFKSPINGNPGQALRVYRTLTSLSSTELLDLQNKENKLRGSKTRAASGSTLTSWHIFITFVLILSFILVWFHV